MDMETIRFDDTDMAVSEIGFGEMQLSLRTRPPRDQALEVLHRAFELGVRFVDTADSYCRDNSEMHHGEALIAEAIETYPGDASDVRIATKGGLVRPEGRWVTDGDPERLRRTIRESFEALGGEQPIDVWQLHAPDEDYDVRTSLEPAAEAIEDGRIRHVGVSNFSVDQIEKAREVVEPVSVQNQWNPWHRNPEDDGVLDYCEERALVFLPWSPFSGRSTAEDVGDLDVLEEVGSTHGASAHRVLLAWMMATSPSVLPIPGASRVETLEDSMRAVELELSEEEVDRIDRALP